jgi:hypothetical protein
MAAATRRRHSIGLGFGRDDMLICDIPTPNSLANRQNVSR